MTMQGTTSTEGRDRHARFLSVAAHDLRGHMANVRAFAAMLLDGRTPLDPKARRWLEVIVRNADQALGRLRDYFDAAQAAAGVLEVDRQLQPVLPLLQSALQRAQEKAHSRAVHLHLDLPSELPEISVERSSLEHALDSFLEHGLSRTPDGGRLEVSVKQAEGLLVVAVADMGPPVHEGEAPWTFDPERQAEKEQHLATGFRLGLAAIRIRAHGGQVGIEQDTGRTTFYLALPLQESRETACEAPPGGLEA